MRVVRSVDTIPAALSLTDTLRWIGPQSRPPRATTYTKAMKKITENSSIDQKPNDPSELRDTAYGYTKMISMSNMMNSIATM